MEPRAICQRNSEVNAGPSRTLFERLSGGVARVLLRHVLWHAREDRSLSGQPGERFPLVIILGREHYQQSQKHYPALRSRDLHKVLRQELAGQPPTLTLPGPLRGDGRDVSFFRLDRDVMEALPRSLFVVPESVLLGAQLAEDSWADVERQGYRYFVFHDGKSQPAGGALGRRDLVALAAGMDPNRLPDEYQGSDELLPRFSRSLTRLPASTWWSCRNPLPHRLGLDRFAWKPLAMTAGLMLFAYLALSSVYMQTLLAQRNAALEALEPEIQEGLIADNQARRYEAQRDALIGLWTGQMDTQQLWQAVAVAVQNKATISRIDLRGGRVSLRGEAPDASQVFAELDSLPQFENVSFEAPVRSVRGGRQNFALSFALSDEVVATEMLGE